VKDAGGQHNKTQHLESRYVSTFLMQNLLGKTHLGIAPDVSNENLMQNNGIFDWVSSRSMNAEH
jgi:hypothetical protein